jgi:stage V sporulation protein B
MSDAIGLATRYSCLILTPLGFGLLATAKPALALFVGQQYVGGSLPLMVFCAADAVTILATGFGPVFPALEKTKKSATINGVTGLVSMLVAFVIIPKWGVLGASAGRALAIILQAALQVVTIRRMIIVRLDLKIIAKTLVSGATMTAVIEVVQLLDYNRFMLPLYVLIGALVYLLMMRLVKALDAVDLDFLRRFLGKRMWWVGNILTWILVHEH